MAKLRYGLTCIFLDNDLHFLENHSRPPGRRRNSPLALRAGMHGGAVMRIGPTFTAVVAITLAAAADAHSDVLVWPSKQGDRLNRDSLRKRRSHRRRRRRTLGPRARHRRRPRHRPAPRPILLPALRRWCSTTRRFPPSSARAFAAAPVRTWDGSWTSSCAATARCMPPSSTSGGFSALARARSPSIGTR